jgi:hypothetical protein
MLRGLAEESSPGATDLAAAMRRAFDDATD